MIGRVQIIITNKVRNRVKSTRVLTFANSVCEGRRERNEERCRWKVLVHHNH